MLRVLIVAGGMSVFSSSMGTAAMPAIDFERAATDRNLGGFEPSPQDSEFQRAIAAERVKIRMLGRASPADGTASVEVPIVPGDQGGEADRETGHPWSDHAESPPLVLVSFSMPSSELKALVEDAARIEAVVVLRGLVKDSFAETGAALADFARVPGAAIRIDPTLFTRFRIEHVPAFILPLQPLQSCTRSKCPVPLHVRVDGSAGLSAVLDRIRRNAGDERARTAAERLLARLRRQS